MSKDLACPYCNTVVKAGLYYVGPCENCASQLSINPQGISPQFIAIVPFGAPPLQALAICRRGLTWGLNVTIGGGTWVPCFQRALYSSEGILFEVKRPSGLATPPIYLPHGN